MEEFKLSQSISEKEKTLRKHLVRGEWMILYVGNDKEKEDPKDGQEVGNASITGSLGS